MREGIINMVSSLFITMNILNRIFPQKVDEELPVKEVQTEQWKLPERFFPMLYANFEFTQDHTLVTIFDDEGSVLYNNDFDAFDFKDIPHWLKDVLITCRVINK